MNMMVVQTREQCTTASVDHVFVTSGTDRDTDLDNAAAMDANVGNSSGREFGARD